MHNTSMRLAENWPLYLTLQASHANVGKEPEHRAEHGSDRVPVKVHFVPGVRVRVRVRLGCAYIWGWVTGICAECDEVGAGQGLAAYTSFFERLFQCVIPIPIRSGRPNAFQCLGFSGK